MRKMRGGCLGEIRENKGRKHRGNDGRGTRKIFGVGEVKVN